MDRCAALIRRQWILTLVCNILLINFSYAYNQINLVSNGFPSAQYVDQSLLNSWGLAAGLSTAIWVANVGTGQATIYNGEGTKIPLNVTIPTVEGLAHSEPTACIADDSGEFMLFNKNKYSPAKFIFATQNGTIAAWSISTNFIDAITVVDRHQKGAVYTGLASAYTGDKIYLYATNFFSGKVEVFDRYFNDASIRGDFKDPMLPPGYAPYGIHNIHGDLYVTFAKQDETKQRPLKGVGLGIVDVFSNEGFFIRRVASLSTLNAPWGIALAPANFGKFSNALLIANSGDGRIYAYDYTSNLQLGRLRDDHDEPITIDGLKSIKFGNGFNQQLTNALFFTAAPLEGKSGLFGKILP